MLRSGAGVQEICNSVYRESEVASVAHKERLCVYWHCRRTGGTECWNWGSKFAGKKCPKSDACEHWRTCEMCNGVMGQCKKKAVLIITAPVWVLPYAIWRKGRKQ